MTDANNRPAVVGQVERPVRPGSEARWYCLSREGMATLCACEKDAKIEAATAQQNYPRNGPYRAVQMVDIAAVSAEREKALQDAARLVDEDLGHAVQDGWSVEAVQALMATRDLLRAHADMHATNIPGAHCLEDKDLSHL